ncbi:MSMEG_1061 family FMN-dependent PPOX-type flavoprotein [Nocardia terpenica]|nr:MSMEG_1061 family FMN-dependent PPOX-type flavoprotein [Nocardia terpenica]
MNQRTAADNYRPIDMTRIREIIGYPTKFIEEKKSPSIGDFARRFIAHSTFYVFASVNAAGQVDASPKGDPPGSVKVLDPWTLAIPDRPGNKGIDTFRNLVERPGVGLLFLVPGVRETLRINGNAFVTDEPDLLRSLAADGKPALLATVVRVEEVFYQCGKALIRSHLWNPDLELAAALLLDGNFYCAAGAEMGHKAAAMGVSLGEVASTAEEHYETTLY